MDPDLDVLEPDDVIEEDVDLADEPLTDDAMEEIPVHGVATIEGKATGDGRGFMRDSIVIPPLPAPFGYEYEYGHGGDNSKAVVVGRLDEIWKVDVGDYVEVRYRGVIFPSKPYANEAIEGIIDGTLRGVSVKIDDVAIDMTEAREQMRSNLIAERDRNVELEDEEKGDALSDEQIEALVDEWMGDGEQPVTWVSRARTRNFDMVHMPAFVEGYIALGMAFEDELSEEDRAALVACGCGGQASADDDEPNIVRGDEAFRDVDADERKKLAKEGNAMPDGSFPIANEEDLKNAIQAIGRAKDPEAAKRHIKKRARQLGLTDLIPDDWAADAVIADGSFAPGTITMDQIVASGFYGGESGTFTEAFAPGTKDGPGWITHPRATARIRRYWVQGKGAAKIKWGAPGDFNRCRSQLAKYVQNPDWLAGLCANMHKEALGFWPGEHHGANAEGFEADATPMFALVASAAAATPLGKVDYAAGVPADWFADPQFEEPTGLTITDDGRVYGHLALWNACHVGYAGMCQNPTPSTTDYAYFYRGVIETDEGPLRIGHLTYDEYAGHADIWDDMSTATAHYDKPGYVRAHVRVGEDVHGIWYAGVLREGLTDEEIRAFKVNGSMSGDWRWVNAYQLELCAATGVAAGGFPVPAMVASGGIQRTLITPPVVIRQEPGEAVVASGSKPTSELDAEFAAGIARAAAREVLAEQDRERRLAAIRPHRAHRRVDVLERARAQREAD